MFPSLTHALSMPNVIDYQLNIGKLKFLIRQLGTISHESLLKALGSNEQWIIVNIVCRLQCCFPKAAHVSRLSGSLHVGSHWCCILLLLLSVWFCLYADQPPVLQIALNREARAVVKYYALVSMETGLSAHVICSDVTYTCHRSRNPFPDIDFSQKLVGSTLHSHYQNFLIFEPAPWNRVRKSAAGFCGNWVLHLFRRLTSTAI